MQLLNETELEKLSVDEFVEYCEEFADDCDLTLRHHRAHAGDLIKLALARSCPQCSRFAITSIADALIIS